MHNGSFEGGICAKGMRIIEDGVLELQAVEDASTAVRMRAELCLHDLCRSIAIPLIHTEYNGEVAALHIFLNIPTLRLPYYRSCRDADRRRYPPSHYFG